LIFEKIRAKYNTKIELKENIKGETMILAIVFAYLAYQKATATEKNGWKWAAIVAGAFIGTQLAIQLGIGILIGIYATINNTDVDKLVDSYWLVPTIVSIGLSILVGWILLRYLDKVPEEQNYTNPPQPPHFE
jgi:Na+/glutamate symporter